MMVVERRTASVRHDRFDLPVGPSGSGGDALVVNDSKVIPARLTGKEGNGGRGRDSPAFPGERRHPADADLGGPVRRRRGCPPGSGLSSRKAARPGSSSAFPKKVAAGLHRHDSLCPLPGAARCPCRLTSKEGGDAHSPEDDIRRYQTVYARQPGSIAAPTAGLHFSEAVLTALEGRGIAIVPVTLHVGYGTFLPIETAAVEDHVMEAEFYRIGEEAAERVNRAERVICVGIDSARAIESAADGQGRVSPASAWTRLYIYPVTGSGASGRFSPPHLPRSSLFLLVCALAGGDLMRNASPAGDRGTLPLLQLRGLHADLVACSKPKGARRGLTVSFRRSAAVTASRWAIEWLLISRF